ncbi:MAG: D-alanyl-D-alanine carboxypeptidase [Geminicoccaceae bacterium]
MRRIPLILGLLCLLLAGPLRAATLDEVIRAHGFAPEAVGIVVEDAATGRRLVEHRADRPGPAASTLKLVTAIGVLDALGPEHRFATRVLATGPVDPVGRLAGDLVLEGGGDPLLDIDGLMALAWALRRAGIEAVAGRFILDDASLPRLPVVNPKQPVEAGYNAGIGALSLAFNRVRRAAGGGFTVPALRERGPAWARLPMGQAASVPVQDAGLHAALVFRDLASSLGIGLPEPVRAAVPAGAGLVAEILSRPLRDIVQAMLLYSNHQIAEILGLEATGAGSLARSAEMLAAHVEAALPDVDWRGFVLTNHSGLDPAARASPDQLLAILTLAEARHDIISLLPAAAWSGSLERRLDEPATALRVWAKTGSLDFASALLGYVLPQAGGPRRIAVLIEDAAGRRARDAVEVPPPAMRRAIDDFTLRARDLRDALAVWALELPG